MFRIMILLASVGICQAQHNDMMYCEILTSAVHSTHFSGWYETEVKDGVPVILFDGTNNGTSKDIKCDTIMLAGKGIVTIKPLDFKVDVNEVKQKVINPRIILHKLEKTEDGYIIAFLYSELNRTLTLYYNGKGGLTDYDNGAF